MLDSTRRKILQDMGIDVWLLRAAPGAADGHKSPPSATPQAVLGPAGEDRQPSARTGSRARDAAVRQGEGSSAAGELTPNEDIDTPAVERLVVESLALAGVVMLLPALNSRRDVRLAGDLVAAAARNWSQPPQRRRFASPPGTRNTADTDPSSAVARALRAFVDKDLQDHEARFLICVGSVAVRLPEVWPGVRVLKVSDLAAFSRDPQAKKRLWAELCVPGM